MKKSDQCCLGKNGVKVMTGKRPKKTFCSDRYVLYLDRVAVIQTCASVKTNQLYTNATHFTMLKSCLHLKYS